MPHESMEQEECLSIKKLSEKWEMSRHIHGFPSEFLKLFWGKLKYFLLRALNHAYVF